MTKLLQASDQRRHIMSRIKSRDTGPELSLRRAIWAHGLRYRVHYKIGKTRPDIVFVNSKLAIFVDGCFWHGCPQHSSMPKNNRDFWRQKLIRNRQRDEENAAWLRSEGWKVRRFWEHEVNGSPLECAHQVILMLNK